MSIRHGVNSPRVTLSVTLSCQLKARWHDRIIWHDNVCWHDRGAIYSAKPQDPESTRGFVLFVVLVFLQLITVLSLISFNHALIELKMSQDVKFRYQTFYSAEKALKQAENLFFQQKPHCLIPETTTDELLSRPLSFWQSSATCAGNFSMFEYYYVLESLGEDPCGYLENTETTVDFFRLTLLGYSKQHQTTVRLQTLIAAAHEGTATSCQKKIYHVTRGRQSWRELTKGKASWIL